MGKGEAVGLLGGEVLLSICQLIARGSRGLPLCDHMTRHTHNNIASFI